MLLGCGLPERTSGGARGASGGGPGGPPGGPRRSTVPHLFLARRGLFEVKVPETIAECEKKFGAVLALQKISFAELKMNPHSQPAIQTAIDHLMQFPENHNFCIRSRRCYCCRPDGTWTAKDEISRKRFFDKIREKIWAKYRPLVLESLSRPGAPKQILDFATTHFKEHIMRWNNEDVQRSLEKYRPVLELAWERRVMKPRGTQ